jgi:multidrug efflux pump subunit AcrA (membrane-fusion protein)
MDHRAARDRGRHRKKGQLLAKVDERHGAAAQVLVARLKAMENQGGVVQAQSGQVDQETLGKYESETNCLKAARRSRTQTVQLEAGPRRLSARRRSWPTPSGSRPRRWRRARSTYHQTEENLRKAQSDYAAARGTLSAAGGSRRQVQVLDRQRSCWSTRPTRSAPRSAGATSTSPTAHHEPGRRPGGDDLRAPGRDT